VSLLAIKKPRSLRAGVSRTAHLFSRIYYAPAS